NSANGTFELRNVPPGSYWIRADAPVNPNTPDPNQRLTAQIAVDVTRDVHSLVLAFTPGVAISGRVSIDGGASFNSIPDYDRIRVFLAPVAQGSLGGGQVPTISSDGGFKLDSVQLGDYRLSLVPTPTGMYVKTARVNQTDVSNVMSVTGPINGL